MTVSLVQCFTCPRHVASEYLYDREPRHFTRHYSQQAFSERTAIDSGPSHWPILCQVDGVEDDRGADCYWCNRRFSAD